MTTIVRLLPPNVARELTDSSVPLGSATIVRLEDDLPTGFTWNGSNPTFSNSGSATCALNGTPSTTGTNTLSIPMSAPLDGLGMG